MQVLPATPAAQHVAQAMVDLDRAALAFTPTGLPGDPPPPIHDGARAALREALGHLDDARAVADAAAGRRLVDAAIREARTAVALLERPAIMPPGPQVFARATEAGRLAREALLALE